jgi:hypothetical protein
LKYWRGYLIAGILAVCTWAITQFAASHALLLDMVYPYMIRVVVPSLTQWTANVSFCMWQMLLLFAIAGILASVVLMLVFRWNPIQWFGWVMAVVSLFSLLNTGILGLGQYNSSISESLRLEMQDYSQSHLEATAIYYRDLANELSSQVKRKADGTADLSDFEDLVKWAGNGFDQLTYDRGFAALSGNTAPVKALGWSDLYTSRGITGMTVLLTGESAVNLQVPQAALPFTICHEMAHRMGIAQDADADFAAILACSDNDSIEYRYAGYLMAYRACYLALGKHSLSAQVNVSAEALPAVTRDLAAYSLFLPAEQQNTVSDTLVDLLVSWHIQEVILPANQGQLAPDIFDPMDETDDRLQDIVNGEA